MSGEKRMQAAEMQMKTENSVEAASAILRTLRHAVPVAYRFARRRTRFGG